MPPEVVELPANDYRPGLAEPAGTCPADAPVRLHVVDAVTVSDVLGFDEDGRRRRLLYNPDHSIADWDALAYMPVHSRTFEGETAGSLDISSGQGWRFGLAEDVDQAEGSPLVDADAIALAIRQGRLAARQAMRATEVIEPLTLRARAGECVSCVCAIFCATTSTEPARPSLTRSAPRSTTMTMSRPMSRARKATIRAICRASCR